MDFEPGSFDCIVDKGTLDTVLVKISKLLDFYLNFSVEKVLQLMHKKL